MIKRAIKLSEEEILGLSRRSRTSSYDCSILSVRSIAVALDNDIKADAEIWKRHEETRARKQILCLRLKSSRTRAPEIC